MVVSTLQKARYKYKPKLPASLEGEITDIAVEFGKATEAPADREAIREIFQLSYGKPVVSFSRGKKNDNLSKELKVGVILSGGQAPGGHNVISGLFDGLIHGNPASRLYGFLGGPSGLIENRAVELKAEMIYEYRNTGGFDIIGSGRTKVETQEQFAASLDTAKKLGLNAVVIIGGDDSNTNAAFLAEYFLEKGSSIQVIGCPKTIDGDLKNEYIETSFGFDTACKTYSELIGNIQRDAHSAKKYWHFIKLMGRAASHIALECALQTQPNVCLVSEEVEEKKLSLNQLVEDICAAIIKRSENKEDFGVILIPEGLVEFIPEMKLLIEELNDALASREKEFAILDSFADQVAWLGGIVSGESYRLLKSLPHDIALQFLVDRDPHGNVQVSRIETEKLLIGMVEKRLAKHKADGEYKGKFSPLGHFLGYEGRCAFPTNFDADYCYSLGYSAFVLIASGVTGYMVNVRNLASKPGDWVAGGVPLTMLMHMEQRHGIKKPVIKKALVDLNGEPFRVFDKARNDWAVKTSYLYPGAIQYFGPVEICDAPTKTLMLEKKGAGE